MKAKFSLMAALWLLPLLAFAQASSVITMDEEPHHHMVMQNDYVKVFKVKVTGGDAIATHRHDHDTVAIAIGDQQVTVGVPGKPDVHQKNADGQVRLQMVGYVHSTRIDKDTKYLTVAVELLHPQGNPHNLCAHAIAGQPLHCPDAPAKDTASKYAGEPEFQTDQTRVQTVRVLPHQSVSIGNRTYYQLIVALDQASISPGSGKGRVQALRPGDFVWFEQGGPSRVFQNKGNKEARFIEIAIKRYDPHQLAFVPQDRPASGSALKIRSQGPPSRFSQARF
jgi:hypothetical protein